MTVYFQTIENGNFKGIKPANVIPTGRRHAYGLVKLAINFDATDVNGLPGGSDLVFFDGSDRHVVTVGNTFSATADPVAIWNTGTGGRLDNSTTTPANASYHIFIGYNPSTGDVNAGMVPNGAAFDAATLQPVVSVSAAAGYLWLYCGSLRADSNGDLLGFVQVGDRIEFTSVQQIFASTLTTTAGTLHTTFSPSGLETIGDFYGGVLSNAAALYLNPPLRASDDSSALAAIVNVIGAGPFGNLLCATNTSAQVAAWTNAASTTGILRQRGYRMMI